LSVAKTARSVIASEAKQSSARRKARLQKALNPPLMPRFSFGALRARWIASSLRSSQ
jgi:hypothetical protein